MSKIWKIFCLVAATLSVGSAISINCTFEYLAWSSIGSRYCCLAKITDDNDLNTLTVAGIHMAGKTNTDVEGFEAKFDKKLNRIPSGLENFFPNLIGFHWYNGNPKHDSLLIEHQQDSIN
jgi:hypothetical protein